MHKAINGRGESHESTGTKVQNSSTLRWDEVGTVTRSGKNSDYIVELPGGRTRWRNRRFLRPAVEIDPDVVGEEDDGVPIPGEKDDDFRPRRGTRERKKTVRFSI